MPKLPDAQDINVIRTNAVRPFVEIPNVDIQGAYNQLADGISSLGRSFSNIAQNQQEEYRKAERFNAKMQLMEAEAKYNEEAGKLDPLADDYGDQVVNVWDNSIKDIMVGLKDPENKRYFGENLLQNRFTLKSGAGEKQKTARAEKQVTDLNTYVDEARKKVRAYADDPDTVYKNVEQMIADAPWLDEKQKQRMRSDLLPKLSIDILETKALGLRGGDGSPSEQAAALLRKFEGYRDTPYWDVNAHRVGYGSDTVTMADGSVVRVQKGMKINRADAERDLSRRVQEFANRAASDAGEAWGKLNPQQQAALTSVAYNYGSLPTRVVRAIQTGDAGAIANAVESLSDHNGGINQKRRQEEAAIIRGSAGIPASGPVNTASIVSRIEQEPYFQSLSVDQQDKVRSTLTSQLSKMDEEDKVAAAQRKLEMNTRMSSDLKSIADTGQADESLTFEEVAAVATPKEAAEWQQTREVNKAIWDNTSQFVQMPDAFITLRVNDMKNQLEGLKGTPQYGIMQKVIQAAEQKHEELRTLRRDDPFTAAEQLPAVRQYVEALTDPRLAREGEPAAQRNEKIIEAAMEAQRQFGFRREADIAPLPKAAAVELGMQLQQVGFEAAALDQKDSMAAATLVRKQYEQLQSIYGKYTPDVIAYSLGVVTTMSRDSREALADTLTVLGTGKPLPVERREANRAKREAEEQQRAMNGWRQNLMGWMGGDEEEPATTAQPQAAAPTEPNPENQQADPLPASADDSLNSR